MYLRPVLKENPDYAEFNKYINDVDVIHGIDDEIEIGDNMAHRLVNDLWLDVLADNSNDTASVFTFQQYMKLIDAGAPGFVYAW